MRKEEFVTNSFADVAKDVINDLCTTCNHYQICSVRKDRRRPIWFCEEFDNYVPVKEVEISPDLEPSFKEAKKETQKFTGLCMNCENREHCKLPKPNGGIWHCEEYR